MAAPVPRLIGPLGESLSTGELSTSPSGKSGRNLGIGKAPSESEIVKFLGTIPYFQDLQQQPETLKKVSKKFTYETLEDGQTLFEQDADSDTAFVICQGSVEIVDQNKQISVLGPKVTVGEFTLFTKEKRTVRARAIGLTSLLKIKHEDLRKLFEINSVALGIIKELLDKIEKGNLTYPGLQKHPLASLHDTPPASSHSNPGSPKSLDRSGKESKDTAHSLPDKLSKQDDLSTKIKAVYHLARKIMREEEEILVSTEESKLAQAENDFLIAKARVELAKAQAKSRPLLEYEKKKAVGHIERNGGVDRIKIKEFNLRNTQIADSLLLRQKIYKIISLFRSYQELKLPLLECVKLLYATALLDQTKVFFNKLKPICDQFFTEDNSSDPFHIYQKALVIYKLSKKSPNAVIKKTEVKHTLHLIELLKNCYLFQISFIERLLIVFASEEVIVEANTKLFEKDDRGECMYFIENGSVDVYVYDKTTDETKILRQYGKGQCFGEFALLDPEGGKRTAAAKTTSTTVLLKISSGEFKRMLKDIPTLPKAIFIELTKIIKRANAAKLAAENPTTMVPRVLTREMGFNLDDLKLAESQMEKLKADPPLNENDVFVQPDIEKREDSKRLTRKELVETKKELEKLLEDDKDIKKVSNLLETIYDHTVHLNDVKLENIIIPLWEILRSYNPHNKVTGVNKIIINDEVFYNHTPENLEVEYPTEKFFEDLLKKAFPLGDLEIIKAQVKTLIEGKDVSVEKAAPFLQNNQTRYLTFLKSLAHSCIGLTIHKVIRETLLPKFLDIPAPSPYKTNYSDTEINIKAFLHDKFTVAVTRKLYIEDSSAEKRRKYIVIPIEFTITSDSGSIKFTLQFPEKQGIEPGCDFDLYKQILLELEAKLEKLLPKRIPNTPLL